MLDTKSNLNMLKQCPGDQSKKKIKIMYFSQQPQQSHQNHQWVGDLTATVLCHSVSSVCINWQAQNRLPWVGAVGIWKRGRSALALSPVTSVYMKCSNALLHAGQIYIPVRPGLQAMYSCQCFDRIATAKWQSPQNASVCHFMRRWI